MISSYKAMPSQSRCTILLLVALVLTACGFRNEMRAKVTVTRIRSLSAILLVEQPDHVDSAFVESILVRHDAVGYHLDGWGNPIQIEIAFLEDGERSFRITSYGRDGVASSCCRGGPGSDWDRDAVLEGDKWLQVWN